MRQLEWSSLRDQVRLQPLIVSAVVASLESSTPLAFIASVTSIWKRLENIDPRHLFQDTVCACSKEKFDHAMLTEQPLLLFRCDDRLFSNGSLLSCFLDMLSFYNQASKSLLVQKLAEAPFNASNRDDQRAECDELTRAAMGAQDSAIVQLLLEICERTKDDRVRQLACGHIHQMFIADPMLSKLVHFQGYPVRLIPIAVSGIPSMHICLEFVHELLALPDINKRVFAIVLVAELSRQYKIESSFLRVELIVDILSLLMKTLPCDEILSLCMETVPSLGQMMTIFPQIAPDITHFLAQISVIAKSRMALSATVLKPRSSPERKLIDLICRTLADKAAEMSITNLAG
ncbi:hypothetical protein AB6A40_002232 [Gnathostoma spinigerum]|uniref:Uncharacterized protein n=1 Tax=Gnathostoma spinigerum TaxID=75299 RepID=A0ABD6EF56_9BILA